MLMVSQLVRVARGALDPADLLARAPARFEGRRAHTVPVVVWNVCLRCPMTCPHCYAGAGPTASDHDLSTPVALRVVDELAEAGVRHVIFSGGEPLLRPDIFELIAHATERGLGAHLSTSGVPLDEVTVRRVVDAGVSYVGVSLDGLAPFNDAWRGYEGGFALASEGLRRCKDAGLRTGLRMTLTSRNRDHLDALLAHARHLGVDRFYVSHLVYAGRGLRLAGDDLSPSESRALLWHLFDVADELAGAPGPTEIVTGGNDSDGPLLVRWTRDRYGRAAEARVHEVLARRGGNSAGEGVLDIDHRGRVHPDQFWARAVLGDLTRQPFAEVLSHPLRAELRGRTARLEGRCGGCRFLSLCRGSHRERALAATGNMWASDPACVMRDDEIAAEPVEPLAAVHGGMR